MSKEILILNLKLQNFKGAKQTEINFRKNTSIFGDNATGKTTLFDAFTWVLFGKDSEGKTDFGLKTNDEHGNPIERLEHSVEATISVDGEVMIAKKVLKESWVKPKGSLTAEFRGNVTEYFWNDVPKKQREYQEKVSELVGEDIFKLITNPLAFNSLKWQDARDIVIDLAGKISNEDLAKGNSDFQSLLKQIANKSLKELKDELAFKKKSLSNEIKSIPTRVDEVYRSLPEKLDYNYLLQEKTVLENKIKNLESQLEDKSKAYEKELDAKNKLSQQMFEQNQIMRSIEFKLKSEIENEFSNDGSDIKKAESSLSEKRSNLNSLRNALETLESKLKSLNVNSDNLNASIEKKRSDWDDENKKELKFDDNSFVCPSCKRDLEATDIEAEKIKMSEDFNTDKTNTLLSIQKEGVALSEQLGKLKKEIIDIEERIKTGKALIEKAEIECATAEKTLEKLNKSKSEPIDKEMELYKRISVNKEHVNANSEVTRLKALIEKEIVIDNNDIKESLNLEKENLEKVKKQLSTKYQREEGQKRIDELTVRESDLAQQISDLERNQFIIENFEKAKANLIESRVNEKFKLVKFKLFETQINGIEVPCCITLINGVPFSDANTASKINAGLDIINTLSDSYGVTAPIFIDNRESVVNLIDSKSQIINLIVSEPDKTLRVE